MLLLLACTAPKDTPSSLEESDSSPEETGDSQQESHSAQDLVDALKTDLEGTLLSQSRSGWPAPVEEGWLFVSTSTRLTQVAGDFNGWTGQEMQQETGFSWIIIEDVAAGSGYKFTNGSLYEPDPWATSYLYDAYGELSLVNPAFAHLERYPDFGSDSLEARSLQLWVPEGEILKVLYIHDGQNLFDPEAIWGGWRLQDSAPDSMLLVGIDNTAARMDEYTHTEDDIESGPGGVYGGLGDAYGELLQETIRPFIQERFGEPEKPGLMGSSLGGLISLYLAYHFPGEYQFSASLSGTVGWGSIGLNNPTIIELMEQAGHQSTAIYLDSGGGGDCYDSDGDGIDDDNPLVGDNYCENLQLRDTLVSVGYQFEVDLWHWWEPEAEHNETAWAARAGMPMEIFAGL